MKPSHLLLSALLLVPTGASAAPAWLKRTASLFSRGSATPVVRTAPKLIAPRALPKPGDVRIQPAPARAEVKELVPIEQAGPRAVDDHLVEQLHASERALHSMSTAGAINNSVFVYRNAMKIAEQASKALGSAQTPYEAEVLTLRVLTALTMASRAAQLRFQLTINANVPHLQQSSEQARQQRIAKRLGIHSGMIEYAYNQMMGGADGMEPPPPSVQRRGSVRDIARQQVISPGFGMPGR